MKRIFLAADIDAGLPFINHYRDIQKLLPGKSVKWVDFFKMHLTIRFFGNTGDEETEKICMAVLSAVHDFPSFSIKFASLGVFRDLAKPRVIWTGCENPENIRILKSLIDRQLETAGFPPENNFSPHLTLGRIKGPVQRSVLKEVIEKYTKTSFMVQQINSLILYESRLKPAGPEYFALQEFSLGSPA
jgi:RNA 2',3'-cyclic 3'-phosphodiesterase